MGNRRNFSSLIVIASTLAVCIVLLVAARAVVERFDRPSLATTTLDALNRFFPDAEEFVGVLPEDASDNEIQESEREEGARFPIYRALTGEDVTGLAVRGSGEGYGGPITVLVAVDPPDTILGVTVTGHSETTGLGDVIEDDDFLDRFAGRTGGDPIAIGEDIDNISGATWSAEGTAEAVRNALARAEGAMP